MLGRIDLLLNSITMYRLLLFGLGILALISFVLSALSLLPFTPIELVVSLIILLFSCFVHNFIFAKLLKAVTNFESYLITALILFLTIAPSIETQDMVITFFAGAIAMSSKYIFAIQKKHIFNPVALSLFILGFLGFGNAIWWAGSLNLLPFVFILGFLVVRKVRRFYLLWSFLIAAIITIILFNLKNGLAPIESLQQVITSWPLIFFGTIMLTEPLTTPPTQKLRVLYGGLVGILFGTQFSFGPLFASPEFALVVGNIFSYIVSPKQKLFLHFKEKIELGPNLFELRFRKNQQFSFHPGQYFEWTLPVKQVDSRGNRRYFTIASSPTEEDIKLGIKVAPQGSSSFKSRLLSLKKEDVLVASQLSGDFVLPNDISKKLVFIAGGIGVTPFRSMLKYILDTGEKRDIAFFYSCVDEKEFVYRDIFQSLVEKIGLKMVYVVTGKDVSESWKGERGYLNSDLLKKYVPDYLDRTFYLSGPMVMVDSYKKLLHTMGVSGKQIVTDYFPGF